MSLERLLGALVIAGPYFEIFSVGPIDLLDLVILPLFIFWLPRAARENRPLSLDGAEALALLTLMGIWFSLYQVSITGLIPGIKILKRFFYLFLFLFAVRPTPQNFAFYGRLLFYLGVFSAVVAILQNVMFWLWQTTWPPGLLKPANLDEGPFGLIMLRASGFAALGPISLGKFLGPAFSLIIVEFFFPFLGLSRLFLLPGSLLIGLALFLIHSRDVWIGVATSGALTFLFYLYRFWSPRKLLFLLLFLAAGVLLFFSKGVRLELADLYFKEIILRGDPGYRVMLFQDALKKVRVFFWRGCGFERNLLFMNDAFQMPVHFGFLKTFLEQGILGLVIALSWQLWFFLKVFPQLFGQYYREALAALALWVCFMVIICFEPFDPFYFFFYWPLCLLVAKDPFGEETPFRRGTTTPPL